jgi:hypothetical protein
MTSEQLIGILWDKVISWVGLPVQITGDRDTRLTADRERALAKGLSVRLALSASYRPQTDGSTERFNRTFLSKVRTCCHSILSHGIVSCLLCCMLTTIQCILPQDIHHISCYVVGTLSTKGSPCFSKLLLLILTLMPS